MAKLARHFSRRHFLLSLLSLVFLGRFRGRAVAREEQGEDTVMVGGWLLKKSDLP